jgi:hypothetical protein
VRVFPLRSRNGFPRGKLIFIEKLPILFSENKIAFFKEKRNGKTVELFNDLKKLDSFDIMKEKKTLWPCYSLQY